MNNIIFCNQDNGHVYTLISILDGKYHLESFEDGEVIVDSQELANKYYQIV